MIWFSMNLRSEPYLHIWFKGFAYKPEHKALEYTFSVYSSEGTKNYYEMLNEINKILTGDKVMDEPWGIRPFSPSGEIKINKVFATYELKEDNGEEFFFEIPTIEYKKLIEEWIKFIEVNTSDFINC